MKRVLLGVLLVCAGLADADDWVIESQEDWAAIAESGEGVVASNGMIRTVGESGAFASPVKAFKKKTKATGFVVKQSDVWHNWDPIENIGPPNLGDAPVLLVKGPKDYWMFGKFGKPRGKKGDAPAREAATLEGFDIPLFKTPHPNVYAAEGGLKKDHNGYHAWQSRDMVNWVHHGSVTKGFSRWVISAEYVDGKTYIYYDYPNDQDPHVYVDEDLTDGVPGKNMGMALKDPSHGSDSAVIRDLDGNFHIIFEDWSPINASKHSWDSPLAGHAVSKDGLTDFVFKDPPVDQRTKDTGKIGTYRHPHWKQHKDWDSNVAEYKIHEPTQNAFGDWAAIAIGGQYYLFGDFHPAGSHKLSVAWFTSSDINTPFTFCGNIGKGHPDPDVCFAEGRFYLATQQRMDFVSSGPWVETVEARVGVDTTKDGKLDVWTEWQVIKESYDYIKGFSKQVSRTPASVDLSKLPAGFGYGFELKLEDGTTNKSVPIIDRVTMSFE